MNDEATPLGTSLNPKSVHDAVNALSSRFHAPVEDGPMEEAEGELEQETVTEETEEEVEEVGEEISETETEQTEDQEAEDESADTFRYVNDLLDAGGVQAGEIQLTVKVNGEEREVSLEEAIRGYQRQADYDRHMSEIREERDKIRQASENILDIPEVKEKLQRFENAAGLAHMILESDAKALQERYDSVDWNRLRHENPQEYSVLQADFMRESQALTERQQNLAQSYQQAMQSMEQDRSEKMRKVQTSERERLLERRPELRDQGVMEQWGQDVSRYLTEHYGATESELNQLYDHRILDMAWKAREYDRMLSEGKGVIQSGKREKKRPTRTLKPGSKRQGNRLSQTKQAELQARERLSKSHSVQDAHNVLLNRWQNQPTR